MSNSTFEVVTEVRKIQDEYIGYISFKNPFQNVYCSIDKDVEKLCVELDRKRIKLVDRLATIGQVVVHNNHDIWLKEKARLS